MYLESMYVIFSINRMWSQPQMFPKWVHDNNLLLTQLRILKPNKISVSWDEYMHALENV